MSGEMEKMTAHRDALALALRRLRNECECIKSMAYDDSRHASGYTNLKVWLDRIDEATVTLREHSGTPVGEENGSPLIVGAQQTGNTITTSGWSTPK